MPALSVKAFNPRFKLFNDLLILMAHPINLEPSNPM